MRLRSKGAQEQEEEEVNEASANKALLRQLKERAEAEKNAKRSIGDRIKGCFEESVFTYNITLGIYMLDPWERVVFNVAALLVFFLVAFSAYRQVLFILDFLK
jgi:hypothetical protein